MDTPVKLRRFCVKLKHLTYVGTTPEEVRERILDNRIRECRVVVPRSLPIGAALGGKRQHITKQSNMRRCCVRLARINCIARSEIASTPTNSIVLTDAFDDDYMESADDT